jgi:anti-sigma factor RsiW
MRCFDVKVNLQAYVDGELSPEWAALLERHVAGCAGCRTELARLQTAVTALETWPLVAEPVQLTDRVMAQVRPHPVVSAACPEPRRRIEPPALPPFRLRWSDFAISLAGAGLTFVAMLV